MLRNQTKKQVSSKVLICKLTETICNNCSTWHALPRYTSRFICGSGVQIELGHYNCPLCSLQHQKCDRTTHRQSGPTKRRKHIYCTLEQMDVKAHRYCQQKMEMSHEFSIRSLETSTTFCQRCITWRRCSGRHPLRHIVTRHAMRPECVSVYIVLDCHEIQLSQSALYRECQSTSQPFFAAVSDVTIVV